MSFNPKKNLQTLLIFFCLSLFFTVLLVEVRGSYEEESGSSSCLECHEEAFDEDLVGGLVHEPCLEKRCIVCHCSASANSVADKPEIKSDGMPSPVSPISESQTQEPEMTVIRANLHSDVSHSFIFSEDRVESVLLVELWQGKECLKVERVALLPLGQLPQLVDDKRAPQISDIKVEKVERGLSSTAVITWQTDKPATSGIRYGIDELNRHSFPHGCLVRDHRLKLPSLKTNRNYQFSLVSNDFFGNQAVSESQVLSTKKSIGGDSNHASELLPGKRDCAIVKKELFNVDGRYLALFELSQSLSLSIGVAGFQEPVRRLPDAFADSAPSELEKSSMVASQDEIDEHRYLLGEVETTIENCFTCHKNVRKEMSHPVDVLPAPGMQVPKEYKLLSNGRLSCMTCHVRHAGENFFRVVRAQGKQFCEGCHAAY